MDSEYQSLREGQQDALQVLQKLYYAEKTRSNGYDAEDKKNGFLRYKKSVNHAEKDMPVSHKISKEKKFFCSGLYQNDPVVITFERSWWGLVVKTQRNKVFMTPDRLQ